MTKPTDNPADPFKKALSEATKVMADDPDLSVSFTVDPPGATQDTVRLPQVTRRMTRDEVLLARGTADALALRHKHHDLATHARYAPQGELARGIYEAMEHARCEAVGAREMPGTLGNIDAKIAVEADRLGYGQITNQSEAPLAAAAGYLVRHLATGRDLPAGAQNVMSLWQDFMTDKAGGTLDTLQDTLADQKEFAKFARQVISDLGYADQLGDDPDMEDDQTDDQAEESEEDQENPDSQGNEEEQEDTDASPEQSQEEQQDQSQAQVSMDDMADMEQGDEASCPKVMRRWSRRPLPPCPKRTRTMKSIQLNMMKKFAPRIWPSLLNWNACGPIWISSWSR